MRRLLISFSGGETSAFMTRKLLLESQDQYDEIIIAAANTSEENEETLFFMDQCDRLLFQPLGHRVVYLEAVQYPGERKAAGHKVVTFESASRDGSVFEAMIQKYGIPNAKYIHCTRELKLNPITSYVRSRGWEAGTYHTAIGIRADEIDRISISAKKRGIIYPLVKAGIKKPDINKWFYHQAFRLMLKGYQSNCKWCYKKSFRKHLTIIQENALKYSFPARMEALYGKVGGEFAKQPSSSQAALEEGYGRTFFRGNRSTADLMEMYEDQKDSFVPAEDDAQIYPDPSFFDELLDSAGGCGESCEVWTDETDMEAVL